jgi:hypothetical protein
MVDMPTEANKKAATKAKVRLTKTVNGKRVKKTREELSKNVQNVLKAKKPMPTMADKKMAKKPMPTMTDKKMAKKAKVRLTKTVDGKLVKKTREELLKNIKNKKSVAAAGKPKKKVDVWTTRYRAFLKRYTNENYPYIGEDMTEWAENYASNRQAKLENYKNVLRNAENEARRNYGN